MGNSCLKLFINDDCMHYMATMQDKSVDLTITDIPYEYTEIVQNTHEMRMTKDGLYKSVPIIRKTTIGNTNVNRLNFDLTEFLDELIRLTKNVIVVFCSLQQAGVIYDYFKQARERLGGGQCP